MTNINFALESISREMRVGTAYHCESSNGAFTRQQLTPDCPYSGSGPNLIAFRSSELDPTSSPSAPCYLIFAYRFKSDTAHPGEFILEKAEQQDCNDPLNTNDFTQVVSPNVSITGYKISVLNDTANHPYPLAYIRIEGYAGAREKERTYFDVQTSISARLKE